MNFLNVPNPYTTLKRDSAVSIWNYHACVVHALICQSGTLDDSIDEFACSGLKWRSLTGMSQLATETHSVAWSLEIVVCAGKNTCAFYFRQRHWRHSHHHTIFAMLQNPLNDGGIQLLETSHGPEETVLEVKVGPFGASLYSPAIMKEDVYEHRLPRWIKGDAQWKLGHMEWYQTRYSFECHFCEANFWSAKLSKPVVWIIKN